MTANTKLVLFINETDETVALQISGLFDKEKWSVWWWRSRMNIVVDGRIEDAMEAEQFKDEVTGLDLLLVHNSHFGEDFQETLAGYVSRDRWRHTVRYSTLGGVGRATASEIWFQPALSQSAPLSHSAVAAIAAWIQGGEVPAILCPSKPTETLQIISLACQGFLALWASKHQSESVFGHPVSTALLRMGWTDLVHHSEPTATSAPLGPPVDVQDLARRYDAEAPHDKEPRPTSAAWWNGLLDPDGDSGQPKQFAVGVQVEMGTARRTKILELLRLIALDSDEIGPEVVADAYLEAADVLMEFSN